MFRLLFIIAGVLGVTYFAGKCSGYTESEKRMMDESERIMKKYPPKDD